MGGKAKKDDAQLVFAPFYEAFLGIPPTYILLVTAKSYGLTARKVLFFFLSQVDCNSNKIRSVFLRMNGGVVWGQSQWDSAID